MRYHCNVDGRPKEILIPKLGNRLLSFQPFWGPEGLSSKITDNCLACVWLFGISLSFCRLDGVPARFHIRPIDNLNGYKCGKKSRGEFFQLIRRDA